MPGPTGRFRRSDRLLRSRDFQRVAANAERSSCREFVLLVAPAAPHATGRVRLGITASRRVGNAVVRNRVKRSIRAWFRGFRAEMQTDLDLVVIARKPAAALRGAAIAERLDRTARRTKGLTA